MRARIFLLPQSGRHYSLTGAKMDINFDRMQFTHGNIVLRYINQRL